MKSEVTLFRIARLGTYENQVYGQQADRGGLPHLHQVRFTVSFDNSERDSPFLHSDLCLTDFPLANTDTNLYFQRIWLVAHDMKFVHVVVLSWMTTDGCIINSIIHAKTIASSMITNPHNINEQGIFIIPLR